MIIAFPHPPGAGGPGSFQSRFEAALRGQGWRVVYARDGVRPDVVMVIGGTKKLYWLWQMKRAGVPILHRLDGLAWLHRKKFHSIKSVLQGEVRNYLIQLIHGFLATRIVYQSQFVAQWWARAGWSKTRVGQVVYNGIDTDVFQPISDAASPKVLLCVEGTLDYSPYAIGLLNDLQKELIETSDFDALVLYGGFEDPQNQDRLHPQIQYRGKVNRQDLPTIYRNAVYLSLDIHAACPNTVIEALSCGIPVIGFDTGALKELVGGAGKVVPYGGDPWKLEPPDVGNLIAAARTALENWNDLSELARSRAKAVFDLQKIQQQYIQQIEQLLP